jgi:hypothetical protein
MVTWKRFPESLFMLLSFAWSYGVHPPANDLNRLRFVTRGPYCRAQRLRHPAQRAAANWAGRAKAPIAQKPYLGPSWRCSGRACSSETIGFPSKTLQPRPPWGCAWSHPPSRTPGLWARAWGPPPRGEHPLAVLAAAYRGSILPTTHYQSPATTSVPCQLASLIRHLIL